MLYQPAMIWFGSKCQIRSLTCYDGVCDKDGGGVVELMAMMLLVMVMVVVVMVMMIMRVKLVMMMAKVGAVVVIMMMMVMVVVMNILDYTPVFLS